MQASVAPSYSPNGSRKILALSQKTPKYQPKLRFRQPLFARILVLFHGLLSADQCQHMLLLGSKLQEQK